MKLKLVLAIFALTAMPAFAQSRQGGTPPKPKLTLEQIQNVIQIIAGNKTKLQQYCDIAKLDQQIAEAHRRNDTNTLEVLVKQADVLAKKIGREYVAMLEGLSQIDEDSSEGQQFAAALDSLDKLCTR
jgi:hypothetical protein